MKLLKWDEGRTSRSFTKMWKWATSFGYSHFVGYATPDRYVTLA